MGVVVALGIGVRVAVGIGVNVAPGMGVRVALGIGVNVAAGMEVGVGPDPPHATSSNTLMGRRKSKVGYIRMALSVAS